MSNNSVTTGNAYCLVNVEKSCYPTVVKGNLQFIFA